MIGNLFQWYYLSEDSMPIIFMTGFFYGPFLLWSISEALKKDFESFMFAFILGLIFSFLMALCLPGVIIFIFAVILYHLIGFISDKCVKSKS